MRSFSRPYEASHQNNTIVPSTGNKTTSGGQYNNSNRKATGNGVTGGRRVNQTLDISAMDNFDVDTLNTNFSSIQQNVTTRNNIH
jgi:hypothetical protein